MSSKCLLLITCCLMALQQGHGQAAYNPAKAFAPLAYTGSTTHGADGRPGSGYWQNRADYQVQVSFDTATRMVKGVVSITYTNHSPQALPYVWLCVNQNRFRKDSRAAILTPPVGSRFGVKEFTNGCQIHRVEAGSGTGSMQAADYQVADVFMKVTLKQPLLPGKKVLLKIAYDFQLPEDGSDYMGVLHTNNGSVYLLGSVFPRMVVYDAVQGWNALGSGYYVEPGTLDMRITVPANVTVQGSGELQQPETVLAPAQLARYRQAWNSDTVVHIQSAGDLHPVKTGTRTWHFAAQQAGDGAWGIASCFNWDGVRVDLPGGRKALAMALYPPGSHDDWRNITAGMKQMLESYSRMWTPYPYSTAVNIAAPVTGIAVPAACTIHYRRSSTGNSIWTKTNHELGHTWFNMMMAADSKHGWMAEGLNTFINLVNCDTLQGEPAFTMNSAIRRMSADVVVPALNTPAASVPLPAMAMVMYIKPAVALTLLRNKVLGPQRFDAALRSFMQAWAFKHPTPYDFFRCMENGAGEELSWFWRDWFLEDWKLDQAIKTVAYADGDPSQGINISLVNRGQQAMPVDVEVREASGHIAQLHFPAQVWQADSVYTFHYDADSPLESVVLDPAAALPDVNRTNNTWQRPATF